MPADRGYDLDANIAPPVDVLNCLPGLRTFSSCGGHPPLRTISQATEGHYQINFNINPVDGGWESLQNLAYIVAIMEGVTIKVWLAGYEPDTIAFELAGIGDPVDLAAIIEMWRTTGELPAPPTWDDPELPSDAVWRHRLPPPTRPNLFASCHGGGDGGHQRTPGIPAPCRGGPREGRGWTTQARTGGLLDLWRRYLDGATVRSPARRAAALWRSS